MTDLSTEPRRNPSAERLRVAKREAALLGDDIDPAERNPEKIRTLMYRAEQVVTDLRHALGCKETS